MPSQYIATSSHCHNPRTMRDGSHMTTGVKVTDLGLASDGLEEWEDGVGTGSTHHPVGVFLEGGSVESPQLHRAQVCGEERLSQLTSHRGMLGK